MLKRLLLTAGLGLALAGCATMTPEECRVADWRAVGMIDGEQGQSTAQFQNHVRACAKANIAPDFEAYRTGHAAGVINFCTPERGFSYALNGGSYNGVCPPDLAGAFMDGYRDGEMIYRARSLLSTAESSVSSARSRRDDIERKLRGNEDGLLLPGNSEAERQRLRNEIDRLRRERREAEDDIYRYERDADFARRDLDRLRFSLGLRWGAW